MAPRHSLNLSNQMSVSHPDYIKICWYDRTAGYLDQLYRGNEQLLSPMTRRYTLAYEFKAKRFLSNTSFSFTRVDNEIDQTWTNEEIEGRQYKVFRWLNAADSWAGAGPSRPTPHPRHAAGDQLRVGRAAGVLGRGGAQQPPHLLPRPQVEILGLIPRRQYSFRPGS